MSSNKKTSQDLQGFNLYYEEVYPKTSAIFFPISAGESTT